MSESRQAMGTATKTESLSIKVETESIKADLAFSQDTKQTKLAEFNKLLGTDNLYAPAPAMDEIFDAAASTVNQNSTQNQSFALKIAENNIKLSQSRIKALEASASPSISIEGYAGWQPYSEQDLEKKPAVGLALVGTLDITDRFVNTSRKRSLLEEEGYHRKTAEAIAYEQSSAAEIQNLKITDLDKAKLYKEKVLKSAQAPYLQCQRDFKTGISSLFEMMDSWRRTLQVENELIDIGETKYKEMLALESLKIK